MTIRTQKTLIAAAAALLLSAFIVAGSLMIGIPGYLSGIFVKDGQETTQTQPETTAELVIERVKTAKPENIRGVWLTAGTDYLTDPAISDEVVIQDIVAKIDDIKVMGFNTVFFDFEPAVADRLFTVNDDGFSIFNHSLDYAGICGLYTVTAYPLNSYISDADSLTVDKDSVNKFVTQYDMDSIMLTGVELIDYTAADLLAEGKISAVIQAINSFSDAATEVDYNLTFVTALDGYHSDFTQLSNSVLTDTGSILFTEYKDFAQTDISEYKIFLESLEKSAADAGGEYITGFRADQTNTGANPAEAQEIIERISLAESYVGCCGFSVRSYSALKSDTTDRTAALLEYLKNLNKTDEDKEFMILNHKTSEITTDESKISFTGNCSPAFPLTCNGKLIELNEAGDFSIEQALKIGLNSFLFEQNGKSYGYKVTYKVDILKSVAPAGKISAPGGTVVQISAVALKNAEVNAVISKNTVKLTQGKTLDDNDEEKTPDSSSDFVTYYGAFTLPAGKSTVQNLGSISVQAKLNGLTKNISGAKVTVTAKPPETSAAVTQPETTTAFTGETLPPGQQGQQLTPYSYAGVPGTSRMCEIATQYCEAMPISPLNDLSYPLTTPLLTGMFDYIDGESIYQEGQTVYQYYHLRCGKRVYRKDVKVIDSGYNLPSNKISVISSSTNGATDINLAMLWKVPVNVIVKGQNYAQIYNTRDFGVWSFTGNSIEFAFSYTEEAAGTVDVSGSNTISGAEWSKNSSRNEMILRLYFKKAGIFYGYNISYNSDGSLKISIKNKPSSSLAGHRIMLDPGHGGSDPGALCSSTTPQNMIYEKQINLALAQKIEERLKSNGATVFLTRSNDNYVSLDDRRNQMYEKKPDMCISIHCDASTSSTAIGTSAFYYYAQSFPLANAIQKRILACYSSSFYTTTDRHSVFFPYRVTRTESCPSVLVEYGFVSNLKECQTLQNNENQNKFADATVQGIIDYITAN